MEVVPQGKRLPPVPFQRRDVEEWSRLDSLTGMLEHARVQTDHWAATTCNSSHHFGKVIDSRARNLADGSKEQRQQTKQLEVFQANIPGGSVQVIRSQSLTTSSWQGQSTTTKLGTGSSWSSTRANSKLESSTKDETEFDNLKLALNPLDLSSQKTKASVGRSGSISSRRPPSRPRSIAGSRSDKPGQIIELEEEITNDGKSNAFSQMSRICQQFHEEAKTNSNFQSSLKSSLSSSNILKQSSYNLTNGVDPFNNKEKEKRRDSPLPISSSGPVNLSFLLDKKQGKFNSDTASTIRKSKLVHQKSCSSEDLRLSPETGLLKTDDEADNEDWRRSSKARRSLQFPLISKSDNDDVNNNSDMQSVNSVLKITKEIEARKQIVANSLNKNNNHWSNIEDVLKKVVNNNNTFEKNQDDIDNNIDDELIIKDNNKLIKKKHSFITVESLKEVRGRLRRLGSPVSDEINLKCDEEDDGIVTESKDDSPTIELEDTPKSVKSYVYGMEALLRNRTNRPTTITGTGSLESRSTNKSSSSSSSNRSEEWYNRRKSYGFEQVNGQSNGPNLYGDKTKVDSSTDSGICRSSETVATIPFWNKPLTSNIDNTKTSHNIMIKRSQNDNNIIDNKEINDYTQTGRKTIVTLGTVTKSPSNWNNQNNENDEQSNINNKIVQPDDSKEIVTRGKIADALRSLREKSLFVGGFESRRLSEPITISIPVTSIDNSSEISGNDGLLLKQTKEPINTDKFNIKKPLLHEDTNQFSTSYSKLLFGNNNNTNQVTNEVVKTSENISSNIHLQISSWNKNSSVKDNEFKRHSIAVDEAKYLDNNSKETFDIPTVKDRIASFRNQFESKSSLNENSLINKNMNDNDADGSSGNEKKPKKVEFCKTEVHFAAESGRFNIVETDGKPPSNNIYRRRRRTIAEPPTRPNNLPEIRFGDSQYEKNLLTCNEVNELDPESSKQIPYRLSPQYIDNENEEDCILTKENIVMRNEMENTEDDKISDTDLQDTDDKPRSILKYNNNIAQNNIYVENTKPEFEENENLNKPVPWKSTVTLQNCENNESELQKLIKNIKQNTLVTNYNPSGTESSAIAADNGLAVRISSAADLPDQRRASWSVAERIRHVEDLKTRGFSTKVNFGSGETTVVTPELRNSPVHDLLSTTWISDSVNTNEQISPSKKVHIVTSSNIVPTYIGPMNKVKSVETLVSTRSGHPKITSISLRYTDDNNVTKIGDSENSRNVIKGETDKSSVFQTRSEISRNTKLFSTETGKITNYPSSDSFTGSSRGLTSMSSVRKDTSDPENKYKGNQRQIHSPKNEIIIPFDEININDEGDKRKSSQILITNRRLHSPCASDSAFLERSSSKHQSYNQITTRHKSMSPVPFPTRPVTNLPDYANTRQINHTVSKQQIPPNESTLWSNASSSTTSSSVLVNKTKKKEIIKTDDLVKKKQLDDITQKDKLQKKERRLSTSSSGRDGWLNTPRENNSTRQKTNSTQTKKTSNIEIKKDKKIISTNNNNKYEIPNKLLTSRHGRESPIYQNREIYAATVDKEKDPFESLETESAILEELTKAADQILLAVNGYTDEESLRVSSDDEYRRKHGKDKPVLKPLTTISELPSKKKSVTSSFGSKRDNLSKTSGSMTQSSVGTSSRTRLCKTSSNSSVEGTPEVKSLLTEERSKRRAARLLQRASSRELLLQNTGASSSEDIASGSENTPQRSKQRVVRRTAKQYSSRTTSHQSSTVASTSRTKDRVHRTGTSTVDEKEPVSHSRRRPEEKTKMNRISAISSSGKTSGATTAASRSERTSRTERRPPERPGVGSGGVGRTRTQHALSKKKTTMSASHKEETMLQNTK